MVRQTGMLLRAGGAPWLMSAAATATVPSHWQILPWQPDESLPWRVRQHWWRLDPAT